MPDIFLQNTLSGEKEKFDRNISMYSCGPTVYDYAHIGNFRTFILSDLIKRVFEYNGYTVDGVMNITDIDDKTLRRSNQEGVSLKKLTQKYEDLFFADLESLNIEKPQNTPRATDNIESMISLIEKLLEKGAAYKSSDGIYFDITKAKDYGKLAHLNLEDIPKERITNDEYDKENPRDFSLWKFQTPEDGEVGYDASFGKGRPGWHIECSAMSMDNLGDTIDIHVGGQDLIFPHHTNEIAQSETVTGKPFVNCWVHGGFITVDGKKMSKSLGNIITLETLREKGIDPIAFRYFVLQAHYSTLLNFTWEAVEGAQQTLKRIRRFLHHKPISDNHLSQDRIDEILFNNKKNFTKYINDDLDIPFALTFLWGDAEEDGTGGIIKGILPWEEKRKLILSFDKVLGLKLDKIESFEIPEGVKKLITERDAARTEKDFAKSDELRTQIESLGYEVMDTTEGTRVEKK